MSLNCKVGDLAVTVLAPHNVPHKHAPGNIGRIVEVLRFVGVHQFPRMVEPTPAVWECRSQTSFIDATGRPCSGSVLIADANLKPIRDPGDEAVDQTLIGNPAPAPSVLSPKPMKERA
jgi:hypothetical protein